MKFLAPQTLVFTHLLIDIICTLIILSLWYQNRKRFEGLHYLTISFFLFSTGLFFISLRGEIPNWLSIILANTLIVGGSLLIYMGLARFLARKVPQIHNYFLLVFFAFSYLYFTYAQPDLDLRILLSSLAILIMVLQCIWLTLYGVPPSIRQLTRSIGLVFVAYALTYSVRIVHYFFSSHSSVDLFHSGMFEALMLVAFQMLIIILTYNFILMINKRLHLEILLQEQKFARAFASSPYAMLLARYHDGIILDINMGFEIMIGYSGEEAIGRTFRDLHLLANQEHESAIIAELKRTGRVRELEIQFRTKAAEIMDGILYLEVINIKEVKFILASLNNITRRKKAEQELIDLNMHLQRRIEEETQKRLAHERLLAEHSRLAAMGKMIDAIAHQWRQPLSILGMIIQRTHAVGTSQDLTGEQWDDFKNSAMRQIKHMSATIDEFRSFYRPEKERVLFQPCACITDAIKLLESQFSHQGIIVEMICPNEAQRFIYAYPNEFKQVILNLLGNARDAILDCRKAFGIPETGQIQVAVSIPRQQIIRIDVSDNGIGIDEDITPQIFDPYFTTKRETGGTGIGLYISRLIVEDSLCGILILAQGAPTTFRIELPIMEESCTISSN